MERRNKREDNKADGKVLVPTLGLSWIEHHVKVLNNRGNCFRLTSGASVLAPYHLGPFPLCLEISELDVLAEWRRNPSCWTERAISAYVSYRLKIWILGCLRDLADRVDRQHAFLRTIWSWYISVAWNIRLRAMWKSLIIVNVALLSWLVLLGPTGHTARKCMYRQPAIYSRLLVCLVDWGKA